MAFIPTIWSARVLANLQKQLVFAALTNKDYEGEVSRGNAVKIGQFGPIASAPYTDGQPMAAPQELAVTDQSLLIDQADSFAFFVNDVAAAQSNLSLIDGASAEAGQSIANDADSFVASLFAGVPVGNIIGNDVAVALTKDNIYAQFVGIGVVLTKARVPKTGRYAVVSADIEGILLQAPQLTTDPTVTRQGYVGRFAGFDIYTSENTLPNTIHAGHPMAITYADQVEKTETLRAGDRFADIVRGLHVYGGKLVRPTAAALLKYSL